MLLPCTICNRTFKPESLEKHIKICEKNATKKRKTFDSSKQRIQGTELAEFLPVIPKNVEKSPAKKSQSSWKQKHLEFVTTIRQARGVSDDPHKRGLAPAVMQTRPANHEQCPHCSRNFGPKAFDRHIEWCKEQKARIPKSPASILAKERLEARIKYRAPLGKSKRTLTREKYSPVLRCGIQELSPMGSRSSINCSTLSVNSTNSNKTITASSMPSIKTNAPRTTASAPVSQHSNTRESLSSSSCGVKRANTSPSRTLQRNNSSPSCGLQRNSISRGSIQRRSSSPVKKSSISKKDSNGGKGETVTDSNSSRKQSTDDSLHDIFTSSCNITRISPPGKKSTKTATPVVNAARNKNKKNEIKSNSVTSEEVYDPYVSAERQMKELLSHGDWSKQEEKQKERHNLQQKKESQEENRTPAKTPDDCTLVSISPSPNELRTSPTSAFTKYSVTKPLQTEDLLPLDRSGANSPLFDLDDLIISGHNPNSLPSPHNISLSALTSEFGDGDNDDNDINRDFTISLSNLSLCSIPNFDFSFEFDMSAANRKSNRSKKYRKKLENAALALQQSVSLYNPGPITKNEPHLEIDGNGENFPLDPPKSEDEMSSPVNPTSLFSHCSPDPKPATSFLQSSHSSANIEELSEKLEPNKKPLESQKNNAMVLRGDDDLWTQDSHLYRRSFGSKISGDSAYSSLNRKSPLADVNSQGLERHTEVTVDTDLRCLSSSGSESSLPPLCSVQIENHDRKSPHSSNSSSVTTISQSISSQQTAPKLSKFCHECGSKYPVTLAKFCCECGVKRLFV
ncbi:serine-rich adhesin for platelets-like isoform X2 [Periplaneta americana]